MPTRGKVLDNRVLVEEGYEHLKEKGFGEEREEGLVLSLYEAFYLLQKGKLVLDMGEEAFLRHASSVEEQFLARYAVFKDIRDRGYVVRTGFKFGTHFRVYPRGKKPGEAHTQYVVYVLSEEQRFEPADIARLVRVATGIRTKLLFAMVDSENDVVYYKIERVGL